MVQSKLGDEAGFLQQSKVYYQTNGLKMQNTPFIIGYSANLRFDQNELFLTTRVLNAHPVFIALWPQKT